METRRAPIPAVQSRTNLQVLKRSRAVPKAGDVFVMQLPTGNYLAGRVILANVEPGRSPVPEAHLLYIYREQLAAPQLNYSHLRPDKLLIAPVWTNNVGWANGYFETIDRRELARSDLLQQHCFYRTSTGKYVDEMGGVVSRRTEPCGEWGLVSCSWIDDRISDALVIPRAR